jgi:hypothetical protein
MKFWRNVPNYLSVKFSSKLFIVIFYDIVIICSWCGKSNKMFIILMLTESWIYQPGMRMALLDFTSHCVTLMTVEVMHVSTDIIMQSYLWALIAVFFIHLFCSRKSSKTFPYKVASKKRKIFVTEKNNNKNGK